MYIYISFTRARWQPSLRTILYFFDLWTSTRLEFDEEIVEVNLHGALLKWNLLGYITKINVEILWNGLRYLD